jgi:hypothetical protein
MRVPAVRVLAMVSCAAFGSLGLAMPASAQTTVGVKAGLNVSSINFEAQTGDPADPTETIPADSRNGVVAGVFVGHQLANRFGVQLEGLISQKGSTFEDGDIDFGTTYLEIPVLASFGIGPSAGPRVRLLAGPTFGIMLSDTQKVEGEKLEGDDKLRFKNGDVGLTIGGALDVQRFTLDVRYTHGVVNFVDDERIEGGSFENRALAVSVGFRFR